MSDTSERCAPVAWTAAKLGGDLRRLMEQDPAAAIEAVDHLVLGLHRVSCAAAVAAENAGVGFEEIGRAHARVEEAGVLIRQAAGLLLKGPAANQAVGQELFERSVQEIRRAGTVTRF